MAMKPHRHKPSSAPDDPNLAHLRIRFQDQEVILSHRNPFLGLGREATGGIILPANAMDISRKHAEIVFENGVFHIRDHSGNGTFVTGTDGETIQVYHNGFPLTGEGIIGLGRQMRVGDPMAIYYARYTMVESA